MPICGGSDPPAQTRGVRLIYWLTFSSSIVPLSSFTLFFSELRTEPCVPLGAGARVTFEIPMTPCVLAVI